MLKMGTLDSAKKKNPTEPSYLINEPKENSQAIGTLS